MHQLQLRRESLPYLTSLDLLRPKGTVTDALAAAADSAVKSTEATLKGGSSSPSPGAQQQWLRIDMLLARRAGGQSAEIPAEAAPQHFAAAALETIPETGRPLPPAGLPAGHQDEANEVPVFSAAADEAANMKRAQCYQRGSSPADHADLPLQSSSSSSSSGTSSSRQWACTCWVQQLGIQLAFLASSWSFLAFAQPGLPPFLLLLTIALTRLHLGWLLLCLSWLLVRGPARVSVSADKEERRASGKNSVQSLAAAVRVARRFCWDRLPLRYWSCVFYLVLLLSAFWAASVVQEDASEGLQPLRGKGGSGAVLPAHSWRGGSLPPLLLNSSSPSHVKIAATAVARGRQASTQLAWLLHTAPRQHWGRLLLGVRAASSWLDAVVLQPLLALLRRLNLLDGLNGTCSAAEGPKKGALPSADENSWVWLLWTQNALQNVVRSLPTAAQTFLCGSSNRNAGGSFSEWNDSSGVYNPPALEFQGQEEPVWETGPYLLALLLLLIDAAAKVLQRLCCSIPLKVVQLLAASGFFVSSTTAGEWRNALIVAGSTAATSFAITFVLLLLLHTAAAATTTAGRFLASLVRTGVVEPGQESSSSSNVSSSNSSSSKSSSSSRKCGKDSICSSIVSPVEVACSGEACTRGCVALEVAAAAVTCWLLLLADRNFVLYWWTSLQPVRLSILSTLLLLRLPSAQVATLLAWPPPLREPALQLQRSQPLRIIDPVAVGSMLGSIVAAVMLGLIWRKAAPPWRCLKRLLLPFSTSAEGFVSRPLGGTGRSWIAASRSSSSNLGRQSSSHLWQQLQLQSQRIAELQKRLSEEQSKAARSEKLTVQLKTEVQRHAIAANRECLTTNRLQQQQEELQEDLLLISSAADEAAQGQRKLQEELIKNQEARRLAAEEALAEKQQLLEQLATHHAQREQDLQNQLQERQLQLSKLQRELSLLNEQVALEQRRHLQQQRQLEEELGTCQQRLALLEAAESKWKEQEMEAAAQLDHMQNELKATAGQLSEATEARDSLELQLAEQRQKYNELQGKTMLTIKKLTADLSTKMTELTQLREELNQAMKRYEEVLLISQSFRIQQALQAKPSVASADSFAKPRSSPGRRSVASHSSGGHRGGPSTSASPDEGSSTSSQQAESLDASGVAGFAPHANLTADFVDSKAAETPRGRTERRGSEEEVRAKQKQLRCAECKRKLSQGPLRTDSETKEALAFIDCKAGEFSRLLDRDERKCLEHQRQLRTTCHPQPSTASVGHRFHLAASGTSDSDGNTHTQSSSQSASEGDQFLLDAPTSQENPSPKGKAPFTGRKGILSKEEAALLEQCLRSMNACVFPVKTMLESFALPQQVLEAARNLAAASGYSAAEITKLENELKPLSNCQWQEDVMDLDRLLESLESAWPSAATCLSLLQRAGEAHTMASLEQKARCILCFASQHHLMNFLPFAIIPRGPQRLALMRLLLRLQPQLQEEKTRLDGLKAALKCIKNSQTFQRLCVCCAQVHEEMRRAAAAGTLSDSPAPNQEAKQEAECSPQREASSASLWETIDEVRAALKKFKVREDNNEFNIRCMIDAAHIHPSKLHGLSLLHVILLRSSWSAREEQSGKADIQAASQGIPETLAEELQLEISKTSPSSSASKAKASLSSSARERGPSADEEGCLCGVCATLGDVRNGRLREWLSVRLKMIGEPIFKTSPGKSQDFSVRGGLNSPSLRGESAFSRGENEWALERMEGVRAILKLYCNALSREQAAAADLGRRIQKQLKEPALSRESHEDIGCGSCSSESPPLSRCYSTSSPEADHSTHAKLPRPPAPEAACPPGHIPNDIERGLSAACQLLKTVHACFCLITNAWTELPSDRDKIELLAKNGLPGFWSRSLQAREEAEEKGVGMQSCPSADSQTALKSAAYAKCASDAAGAAARAVIALERANVSGYSKKPLQQQQQRQLTVVTLSRSCSESGIPCLALLQAREGYEARLIESASQGQQPPTTRLAYSKAGKRSFRSGGSSTSSSPAPAASSRRGSMSDMIRQLSKGGRTSSSSTATNAQGRALHASQPAVVAPGVRPFFKQLSQPATAEAGSSRKAVSRQAAAAAAAASYESSGLGGPRRAGSGAGSFKAFEAGAENIGLKTSGSFSATSTGGVDGRGKAVLSAAISTNLSVQEPTRINAAPLEINFSSREPSLKEKGEQALLGDSPEFLPPSPASAALCSGPDFPLHAHGTMLADASDADAHISSLLPVPPASQADGLGVEDDLYTTVTLVKKEM
ncbi:hypothetical protein Esti_004805 [Eimeria stiedai]